MDEGAEGLRPACFRQAAGLVAAGRMDEADQAARMGERFLKAGALLKALEGDGFGGGEISDAEAARMDREFNLLAEVITLREALRLQGVEPPEVGTDGEGLQEDAGSGGVAVEES